MQRRMINYMVMGIGLTVLFILCCVQITNNYRTMEKQLQNVQIRMADQVEASYVYYMAKQGNNQVSGQEVVFWTQKLMETVSSPDLGNRSIQTEVVALCGKSSILFDSSFGLEYGDNNCCLLSHGASYELFGTKEVKGTTISYNGDEYTIVGSILTDDKVMAYEVAKDSSEYLEVATIDNRLGKSPSYLMEQFGTMFGTSILMDYQWMVFCLKTFVFWVQITILICMIWYCHQDMTGIRKKQFLLVGIVLIASCVLLVRSVCLPGDYLTDIANRDYWSMFRIEKLQSIKYFLLLEKGICEIEFVKSGIQIFIYLICQLIIVLLMKSVLKKSDS